MTNSPIPRTLFDEIDDRQNQLLEELHALNERVEALLAENLTSRSPEPVIEGGPD